MRPRVLIACGIVLALCLWLVSHLPRKGGHTPADVPEVAVSSTAAPANQPLANQSAPVEAYQSSNVAPAITVATVTSATNAHYQKMLALWQTPIDFYGRVIDQDSNPITGASIRFVWSETPTQEDGETASAMSDENGLFSLEGKHGPSLEVSVSKEGYDSSRKDQTGFSYGLGGGFSSSGVNPVLFHLRKKLKGESLITMDYPGFAHIVQLHHDGTPIELDLLKGAEVPAGGGQLKLEFWRDLSNINANVFDWKLQLSAPGGGLAQTDEEFDYQAPSSGYQPSIVIDMPATNQDWKSELRSKYYIQLANGNYGRIDFYLLPYNGVFTVKSAINPTGSQNLEPGN